MKLQNKNTFTVMLSRLVKFLIVDNFQVVFFGDNVPKGRADSAMLAAKECDAFVALGSSMMTMSAFRLIR